MSKETGGPAFPAKSYDVARQTWTIEEGMTLRDYFAAKAMQGLLAGTKTSDGGLIVKDAYALADAMLKARQA